MFSSVELMFSSVELTFSSVEHRNPLRKETIAINLWHACGAFKKFGRSTAELKFGSSAATLDKYPNYENLTHVTVSSPEVIWAYEEAMHLPKGIVKATGVSRTDLFYDSEFVESRRQKLYEIMPEAKDKKVILYAPTWRDDEYYGNGAYKFQLKLNLEQMRKELGDEYVIILRTHYYIADVLDLTGLDGIFTCTFADKSSRTYAYSSQCFVKRPQSYEYGNDTSVRDWTIVMANADQYLGGSGKVDLDLALSLERLGVDIDDQWKQL